MRSRATSPAWKVVVSRKHIEIGSLSFPARKMGDNEIQAFLRALVIRYRTDTPEDMLRYYVNGRAGRPERAQFANVIRYESDDLLEGGWFCGEWEVWARATQTRDEETARVIRQLRDQACGC